MTCVFKLLYTKYFETFEVNVDSLYVCSKLTNNFHDEDGLRVGRRLPRVLLLLELGEGAEDEGEGGHEDNAQGDPGEHLKRRSVF